MEKGWKLIRKRGPGGSQPRLKKLVVFKYRKKIYIYIPAVIRKELHSCKYYNLYVRGTNVMFQFTETIENYTRKVSSNHQTRFPATIFDFSFKPMTRATLESKIQNGNLFFDLKPLIEEKK